jgi:phosphoribosylformimino-5-aminoimidazole carboxamide ribotide isomerase
VIVLPAIDLREGAAVQLVGGDYAAERVRRPDPLEVADELALAGFRAIHVVDLDRATGRGDNDAVVAALAKRGDLTVQVGGGVRSIDRARALFDQGAARVVVGTRAVTEPAFRDELASLFPGKIVLAVDVREREVTSHGWARGTGQQVEALLGEVADLDLHGVLMTAVHVEGSMTGPDVKLYAELRAVTRHRLIASGGVGSAADLRALAAAGAHATVVGMALYTGALDAAETAQEFSA